MVLLVALLVELLAVLLTMAQMGTVAVVVPA